MSENSTLQEEFKNKLIRLSEYFRHDPFYYKNSFDFISREGKMYESEHLTSEQRQAALKRIKSLNGKFAEHQCFHNSGALAMSDMKNNIKYVEGYIYKREIGIPILHAWNEIKGKVIDLTLINKYGEYTLGAFESDIAYCGCAFPTAYIRRMFLSKNSRSILSDMSKPDNLWPILQHQFTEEYIKSLI